LRRLYRRHPGSASDPAAPGKRHHAARANQSYRDFIKMNLF
jgi:hypothetical protein